MQPIAKLTEVLSGLARPGPLLFTATDIAAVFGAYRQLPVLLSRAAKAGRIARICRGIYLYPPTGYPGGNLLFHVASRLRASAFNYLSLETVLSETGVISQVPMNWISLMSSGRSHIVDCGPWGRIEFIHTQQRPEALASELTYDHERRLWRASARLALRDMKITRRSMDLILPEVAHESV